MVVAHLLHCQSHDRFVAYGVRTAYQTWDMEDSEESDCRHCKMMGQAVGLKDMTALDHRLG